MRRDLFVSVVIPLDNDADILPGFVAEVDSIMRRSYGDYELIFIDDGSKRLARAKRDVGR